MSGPFGAGALQYFSGAKGFYPHEIDQSLRFNGGDSPYLSRTPSSAGNKKTWTWSSWIKRSSLQSASPYGGFGIIFAGGNEQNMWAIPANSTLIAYWINTEQLAVVGTGNTVLRLTTAKQRDLSGWYHFVIAMDTTQATANDRTKVYINGVQQTSFDTTNNVAQNTDLNINEASNHFIGGQQTVNAPAYMNMYLAETHFIDGTALTPTSFGETKEGIWIPKAYTGSYGTNGFKLAFQDSSALGDDTSGNGNDFTANNLAATDQVSDSPTNNFATFNALHPDADGLSEGNLKNFCAASSGSIHRGVGTMAIPSSGKWYWELLSNSTDNEVAIIDLQTNARVGSYNTSAVTNGSVLSFEADADAGTLTIYDDESQVSQTTSIDFSKHYAAYVGNDSTNTSTSAVANFGQEGTFAGAKTAGGNSDANGVGDFFYAPPSGYLALCTANLPDPAIDPGTGDDPAEYFNTVLYTGNGSTQSITGVGFQPDWVWQKRRDGADSHVWTDVVRGTDKSLFSDRTDAEASPDPVSISSFDADGFSLGANGKTNGSSETVVAWAWKAGGTAVNNTQGSIASSVSASTESGFSIVSYTGTGANATVGHGLSATPEVVIAKNRDTAGKFWPVYHSGLNGAYFVYLNATDATQTATNAWNGTEPTSSVFSIGTSGNTNASSDDYIAYCFHSVDGYSKFGSYTGNGNADGTFVYTGFRPAWVIMKRTDAANEWTIYDNERIGHNDDNHKLRSNTNEAEYSTAGFYEIDILSNGFKIRNTDTATNASGGTYVYMAFAEQPFKYSNAR